MSLYRRLCEHASVHADKAAIEFDDEELSYSQLLNLVDRCGDYFDHLGLVPGDRIAILALNHPDWFIVLFAAERRGLILVPLNWRLAVDELHYALSDSTPTVLLHDEEFLLVAKQLLQRIPGLVLQRIGCSDFPPKVIDTKMNSTASASECGSGKVQDLLIVYTSGTTGRPKGAVLSNTALVCSAKMSRHMLDIQISDRVLNLLPLFHVGGLNIQPLPSLLFGATLVLQARFDPEAALASIEKDRISLLTVVPALLQALIATGSWAAANLTSVRAISIGSTDVPLSLLRTMSKRKIPVLQVYGATETSPAAIYQHIDDAMVLGSIGRAGSLCEVKLVDSKGQTAAIGEPGEIQVKGDNILSRYWNNEAATSEHIKEGWFLTGDVAHQDPEGNFWFDDRLKHVVISGGENIYPAEIERVIRQVPGVEDVAVCGKPHEHWGEVPVAVVITNRVLSKETVLNACIKLAKFKNPKDVIFVEEFPRNALGKVQIHRLKDQINTTV